jgi:hypothetical protein
MNQKDVIYIDAEDEITTIIDKVKSSSSKLVALVMPKRSSVLQSTVNMKLLKRAADSSKKQMVLITGESSLLPLAGEIGLPVAKTLQSKPEIPVIDKAAEHEFDELLKIEEPGNEKDFDPKAAADKPVGELAEPDEKNTAKKPAKPELTPRPIPLASPNQIDDSIELDNDSDKSDEEEDNKTDKKPKNKKLRVPDFNKFRWRMVLAILLIIVLIVGWILANSVLPKAKIIVYTNTSAVNVSLPLNLSTTASSVNSAQLIVPALVQTTPKTESATVPTTGQQNEGNSAAGTITLTGHNCNVSSLPIPPPPNVPSGWAITSSDGQTFITQQVTTFPINGKLNKSSGCYDFASTSNSTPVTAQSPGSSYNIGPSSSWTVSGRSDVSGVSSAPMSGGTDNIVQTVSQADINSATQKLVTVDAASVKSSLKTALTSAGSYPIPSTFSASTPTTATSANAGAQANTVTVTQTTSFTMLGVQKSALNELIDNAVNQQINTSTQAIFNDGLTSATYTASNQSGTAAQVNLATTATVGPNLSVSKLKSQVAGKKTGDVQNLLSGYTGVTKVTVHYSPFWVSSTPKKLSKITILFEKGS